MVRLALLRLLESFFRHRLIYCIPVLAMIVAAGFSIVYAKPRYNSSGTLYVQNGTLVASLNNLPSEGASWWITPSQVVVNEIYELLQTEAFVRSVVKGTPFEAGLNGTPEQVQETIGQVNEAVWALTGGDNLVRYGSTHRDPQVANQLASQLPESYVLWKLNSDRQDSLAAQDFFTDLITPSQDELNTARASLQAYIKEHPVPVRGPRPEIEQLELDRLQATVVLAEQKVAELRGKEESARLAQIQAERGIRQNYLIIDAPRLPTKPANGLRTLLMENIIFVVVGLILSIVGIIGGAVIDRSLRFPIDTHQWLHLPVLAMTATTPVTYVKAMATSSDSQASLEATANKQAIGQQPLAGGLASTSQE